jgi:hypothetical protein
MKILQIFERMWLVAFGLSIFVAIFNVFKYQKFDNHVYMPIVCGILCVFLWRNLKSQRKFSEKMQSQNEDVDKKEE